MPKRGLFIGLTTIDIQYYIDKFPNSNTKLKTNPPETFVGGPATNAAVAFAHLNRGAYLLSVVGENPFTSLVANDFNTTMVKLIDASESKNSNPVIASVITSGNGDRNIFTHNPTQVDKKIDIENIFTNVKPEIVLLDGFYKEFALECAQYAKKQNIPVVLDCGSWKPQYKKLFIYTDIAICSADSFPPGCANNTQTFEYLKSFGINQIAISRGNKNIRVQDKNSLYEIPISESNVLDILGPVIFFMVLFAFII